MNHQPSFDQAGSGRQNGWKDFQFEATASWRRLPDKGLFFGLLAVWLVLFQFLGNATFGYVDTASLFYWLFIAYNATPSEDGHGNLIPLVVLVLFWWKRQELLALKTRAWWPALLGLAMAVAVHVVGYLVQQPRVSVAALLLGIYSLMGLVWGELWLRASFFPFVLMVFCIPVGSLAENITFPLRLLVTKITVGISNTVLGMEVIRDGSRIFDVARKFNYDVAPACSGIRSLISLLVFTVIYGFIAFRSHWKRGLVISLAVPLAVAGNVVRILCVIIVADAFGHEKGAAVEQNLGFVTFAVAIGCVLGLGRWLREKPEMQPLEVKGA
jgi:exosortase